MPVSEKTSQYLHHKLPIGDDEKILGVYRHHWFAYASIWISSLFLIIVIMGAAIAITVASDPLGEIGQHRAAILAAAGVLSGLVLVFSIVPVWLKSQEQLVLTEQAVLQILQPSLFVNKISQLNLSHVSDVSARQDFFGSVFGFGHITIETPGEQDDYEFRVLPDAHNVAKQVVEAHENYNAALQAGRLHSTLGEAAPIDPAEYQKFLAFEQAQQIAAMQNGTQAQPTQTPPPPQPTPVNPVPGQDDRSQQPPANS